MNNLVLDNGSALLKAGLAATDIAPSIFCPSIVGISLSPQGVPLLGLDALKKAGQYSLRYPIERGLIVNFQDTLELWRYVLQLAIGESKPDALLFTEPPLNPRRNREITTQLAFQALETSHFYLAPTHTLALYSHGKSTGAVVEVGDGLASVAAVTQGYTAPDTVRCLEVAGRELTEYLGQLLFDTHHIPLNSSIEKEVVREMKEKHAFLKPYEQSSAEAGTGAISGSSKMLSYYLPDNQEIKVAEAIFAQTGEALFNPALIGGLKEQPPLHIALAQTIKAADMTYTKALRSNIHLTGGSTLLRGFPDRFTDEYSALGGSPRVFASETRNISPWLGGAIVAQLSTFQKQWISSAEYAEVGPNIVMKKCL